MSISSGCKFIGGPLDGKVINFTRAPALLRATKMRGQERYDVLDQLDDEPNMFEELYCYRILCQPTYGFIDKTDEQGRRVGCQTAFAEYQFYEHQPSDDIMRDNKKWAQWATMVGPAIVKQVTGK